MQIMLMGNVGFNRGVPWLTNTDGELFLLCKDQKALKMSTIFPGL